MDTELKEKMINFTRAHYQVENQHLSLQECLRTITQNQDFIVDEKSEFVQINGKEFQLIDLYCSDYRKPNEYRVNGVACILFKKENRILEYMFYSTPNKIKMISVYEESENGQWEILGKKYELIKMFYNDVEKVCGNRVS